MGRNTDGDWLAPHTEYARTATTEREGEADDDNTS